MRRRLTQPAAVERIVALAGSPVEGALVVAGDPGVGKSRLIDEVLHRLHGDAVLVRANPAEQGFSLSGFSALATAVRDQRAAEFGGRFALRSTDAHGVFAAAHDVLGVLRGLRLAPTLVLIDDVDRMDPQSHVLIGLMAQRLAGTGLRLVVTTREVAPRSPFGGTETVQLDAPAIACTVAQLHSELEIEESIVHVLAVESGGNPHELQQQIEDADREVLAGRTAVELPLHPKSALPVEQQRAIEHLAGADRTLLEDLALAPLLRVAAVDEVDLGALDDLTGADLVTVQGGLARLRDPRVRAQVYWATDGRTRRQRHLALAAAHAASDDRIATWHRSHIELDDRHAAQLLRAAVAYAVEGETEVALECAEHALRLAGSPVDNRPLLLDLAERLLLHGEHELADRYVGFVRLDGASDEEIVRTMKVRVGIGTLGAQPVSDGEVLAVTALHGAAVPERSVALLAEAAAVRAERWEPEQGRLLLQAAMAGDGGSGPFSARALVQAVERLFDAYDGRAKEAPPALAQDLLQRPVHTLIHARSLFWTEQYGAARMLFSAMLALPRGAQPVWAELARMGSIDNEICAGDHRAARALIDTPHPLRPQGGAALRKLLDGWYHASLDHEDRVLDLLAEARAQAEQEQNPVLQARCAALRASWALLHDDPDEVLRQSERVARLRRSGGVEHQLRDVGDALEAALALGMTGRAQDELAAFRERLARRPSRWGKLLLLRARALLRTGEASVPLFVSAVQEFGPSDSPFELGRTQLAFAERLTSLSMQQEARSARVAAVAAFDAAGAVGWAARAAAERSSTDDLAAWMRLGEEERRIVRMVCSGARNRDIADELYVSLRTVEQRLTRIYRSAGVETRAQLVAALSSGERSTAG